MIEEIRLLLVFLTGNFIYTINFKDLKNFKDLNSA